ncbi:MAG: 50S ribosomal protein L32 [Candidatus Nealsonbacteria bacterium]|nr:MAG: 50S ribosomal protein L32 [Candidatus Nealsonbacteria bacterium]
MAVPKQRKTKSRQGQRRSHLYLKRPFLTLCPKCKKPVLPHTVCQNCGYYKGAEVLDVMKKLTKKERKKKEKEMKQKEAAEKKEAKKPEGGMSWEEMSKK